MSFKRLLRTFGSQDRGIAAVEFALILPFMMLLYIGSIELSSAVSVDKRVAVAAGALGDLVARADTNLPVATLNDYVTASGQTMAPYTNSTLRQVVTCVHVDSSGNTDVVWSKGYNGGAAHSVGATYALPTDLKSLSLDSYVIVSEAAMPYAPLFGYAFKSTFNLYHEFFYLPRYGGAITLT